MHTQIFRLIIFNLIACVCVAQKYKSAESEAKNTSISWITHLRQLRRDMRTCMKTQQGLLACFKQQTLRYFDNAMQSDVIPIYAGVQLVRPQHDVPSSESGHSEISVMQTRKDFKYQTWFDKLATSLINMLTTHTLQINLGQTAEAYMRFMEKTENAKEKHSADPVGTARLRRHRYNMIITMMFGVTALGAVLVPMGFQMLSIVSGKALLLAKMALLLASINGLKRVANSGLHYGLYHVPGEHYGYYDRGDLNHGRNVPLPVAVQQPLDGLGLRK